jgi:hypothetical protein
MTLPQDIQTWSPNSIGQLQFIRQSQGNQEMSHLSDVSENAMPVYYVLEGSESENKKGPIYEAVYQNTVDARQSAQFL